MKIRSWTTRVAIFGAIIITAGLVALPASAAGPTFGSIITSANPAIAGQDVRIALVVRGSSPFPAPAGFVQLFDGFLPLGPPMLLSINLFLDHSEAVLFRSFSPGIHLLTMDYTGDPLGNFPILNGALVTLVVTAPRPQSTTAVRSISSSTTPGSTRPTILARSRTPSQSAATRSSKPAASARSCAYAAPRRP